MRRVFLVQSPGGPACVYSKQGDAERHAETCSLTDAWSHEFWHHGAGWLTLQIGGQPSGAGYVHDRTSRPWTLLVGAWWYGPAPLPAWLSAAGVVVAPAIQGEAAA